MFGGGNRPLWTQMMIFKDSTYRRKGSRLLEVLRSIRSARDVKRKEWTLFSMGCIEKFLTSRTSWWCCVLRITSFITECAKRDMIFLIPVNHTNYIRPTLRRNLTIYSWILSWIDHVFKWLPSFHFWPRCICSDFTCTLMMLTPVSFICNCSIPYIC